MNSYKIPFFKKKHKPNINKDSDILNVAIKLKFSVSKRRLYCKNGNVCIGKISQYHTILNHLRVHKIPSFLHGHFSDIEFQINFLNGVKASQVIRATF